MGPRTELSADRSKVTAPNIGGGLGAIVEEGKGFKRCGAKDALVTLKAVFVISIIFLDLIMYSPREVIAIQPTIYSDLTKLMRFLTLLWCTLLSRHSTACFSSSSSSSFSSALSLGMSFAPTIA